MGKNAVTKYSSQVKLAMLSLNIDVLAKIVWRCTALDGGAQAIIFRHYFRMVSVICRRDASFR